MNPRGAKALLILLLIATAAVVFAAPFFGVETLSPASIFKKGSSTMEAQIFWRLRVPRVCLAFLAGSALAASGMAFQAMFRNPLATPFTLGVSSGAALGAALYVKLGIGLTILGISGISFFAFFGGALSVILIYGLVKLKGIFSTATLLLAGVAISFSFSSLILFIQYLSDFTQSFRILRWLMGGLQAYGFENVFNLFPFVVSGIAVLLYLTHDLNLITTGEDIATSRGVPVRQSQRTLFFATSLMVGGVVATCGPIGFVGMMVPHVCRLIIGSNHRYLLPGTLLFGGMFLTICDTIGRTIIAPAEIPVGVITALLGGPFFLWLLLGKPLSRETIV